MMKATPQSSSRFSLFLGFFVCGGGGAIQGHDALRNASSPPPPNGAD